MVLICRVKTIQIGKPKENEEKKITEGEWKDKYLKEKELNILLKDELRKREEELYKWRRGKLFIILIKIRLIIALMHTT